MLIFNPEKMYSTVLDIDYNNNLQNNSKNSESVYY